MKMRGGQVIVPLGGLAGVISAWFIPSHWSIWQVGLLIAIEVAVIWGAYRWFERRDRVS